MCHSSAGTQCYDLTLSPRRDEHVILFLKPTGSVFWRLAPAYISLRSPIQSQMATGILHPSLPCSAWLLPKWWWYTITDSNTHPASISCLLPFNTSIFLGAACMLVDGQCTFITRIRIWTPTWNLHMLHIPKYMYSRPLKHNTKNYAIFVSSSFNSDSEYRH